MSSLVSALINKIAPLYPQAKRWLHKFNGGIFPKYYKELSANQPIREAYIPQRLIMPLQQQVGLPAELLVEVGDKVKKNQLIARSSKDANKALVVPVHAPTSGVVEAIDKQTLPHPSGLQDIAVIIKPDGLDETIDNVLNVSGEAPATPDQLKQIILDAGIVGMGGAGFPTYAKIPNQQGKIHTLLINGAECEPFITCDDLLMQHDAERIIQGALMTAQALGADKVLCGIETNKPSAIKAMHKAAANTIVEIIAVQTVYPMGGQKQLTQELTGVEIPKDAHAVDLGLLMMNVATYAAIYDAVKFGNPLTSRLVSVTGLGLEKPFNIHALIGTPFIELAMLAAPKSELNYPLVMGGPMMGFAVQDNQVPVIKTTNCILANPPEPVEMQMPCIRCGECMDACPVNLLPQQMYWHSQAHEYEKVEKLNVADCIECGCCSYVCPSHIPLVQYYRHAKSEIKEIKAEALAVELAKQRHEFKLARIEREQQEREARLKAKKEAVKKQAQAEKSDKAEQTKSAKPSAAAAAAKAAAAKRAAAKNEAANASDAEIPPARKKAIEAAKKAASQASATSEKPAKEVKANGNEQTDSPKDSITDPKAAAKKAAMAAAKRRAQNKTVATVETSTVTDLDDLQNLQSAAKPEQNSDSQPDPKQAAKAAAMAAAKKRAQVKKSIAEQESKESGAAESEQSEQSEPAQSDTKQTAQNAARQAAMKAAQAAAKRRKQAQEDSKTAKPEDVQIADLTETTEETAASKKERARKAAMQAARAAAKKRKADQQAAQADSESESDSVMTNSDLAASEDKKQRAMRQAKEAAAKRRAQKQAAGQSSASPTTDEDTQ